MTKKSRLEEIREIRFGKVNKLRELGIDPYPAKSQKDYPNSEIVDNYDKYEGKTVTLAGRLMSWREHGNIPRRVGADSAFYPKKTVARNFKRETNAWI